MQNCSLPLVVLTLASLHLVHAQRGFAQLPGGRTAGAFNMQSPTKSSGGSKPNGVLLGTHWSSGTGNFGEVKPSDRTWWIAEIGEQIQIREIPNILFPRKDGFWTAGTKEKQDNRSFERYVWTAPLGKPSASDEPDLSNPGCSTQATAQDILFVGTSNISIREFESATCAHYDEGVTYYVSTPDNPNVGLKISDVLGPPGLDRFNKSLSAMGKAKSEDLDCGELLVSPENWAILRDKGHWIVRGNGSYGGHVCDGYFGTEFDIKIRLPKGVVGYDELAGGWDRIQETFPDAKDAFESPNADFLIVVRQGDLAVYPLENGKIGAIVSRQPLRENEYAVMAQWALGDNVARWDQQVSRLLTPHGE
jgi:hypothetical protein